MTVLKETNTTEWNFEWTEKNAEEHDDVFFSSSEQFALVGIFRMRLMVKYSQSVAVRLPLSFR